MIIIYTSSKISGPIEFCYWLSCPIVRHGTSTACNVYYVKCRM